ncbi:hypothetical protein CCAX7_51650 [Capsulimonas corticalis]|uniref:Uncharacterized protein n=1 Tax=Capsulimonas corticalis TaxID=2219043 RepID=A0A402CP55_9BACT|nr:HAD-IIIC family phosphatase [Capsulimonas corticalis]BDI33114.1 hypothetical protein CCAX7_51650 [Capsulimonas corticalis]
MTTTILETLNWLDSDPSTARHLSAAGKLDKITDETLVPVKIAVLRNFTLEPTFAPCLKVKSYAAGLKPEIFLSGFDSAPQEVFMDGSDLYQFQPDIVAFAMRLHTLAPALVGSFASLSPEECDTQVESVLNRVVSFVRAVRERSSAVILVNNFELSAIPSYGVLDAQSSYGQHVVIRRLNALLREQIETIGSAYIVDVDHLISRIGYDSAIDNRYWHIGRAPYTLALQRRLAAEYVKFAAALKGKNKKCLVLDCDNTLWGGVIGEDGMDGIKLGATHPGSAFLEFHAAIIDLYHRGVLLALNSKNNEADAMEVFEKHPSSLLKTHHFVAKRVNWSDKASNLREIAQELNIGLDSLVFVDDNPFECEFVREALPQVKVIQLPADPTRFAAELYDKANFDTLALNDEDRRRSTMYQAEAQRHELKQSVGSMEEYLRSLEINLTIAPVSAFSIPRIAQLTQKTNQFNVTTRRYSEEQVTAMANSEDWLVCYAQLKDRFDDAGIIAAAFVHAEGDMAVIDTLLMSCRVIGRGVEQALLSSLAHAGLKRGCTRLLGQYIPTPKNGLVTELFPSNGFEPDPERGDGWWKLDLRGPLAESPNWLIVTDELNIEGSMSEVEE